MNGLTIGKIRGLQGLANSNGIFAMAAMDHRGSLMKMLDEENPKVVSYRTMVNYKQDLCRALGPHASAVLLDPIYGAAQAIASGVLPGSTGLLVSVEATGYTSGGEGRLTELLPDWSVEKVKRMGADAVKLLLYYRPDIGDISRRQLDTVAKVAAECRKTDIAFLLETKSYPMGKREADPKEFARIKPQLVIETARQVTELPIDVLKSEFPADMRYEQSEKVLLEMCRDLDRASKVPWVILSAGVDFETFYRQVELACRAGASGFLGGRALWQEATGIRSRQERFRFLETTVAERLRNITRLANTHGKPWYAKLGTGRHDLSSAGEEWYKTY
ncbi:MAG: tagatose 1,6-diphosphate aldolase [Chloroflexi bacterium]|nr:tagatose 1,6-diphosphate aldolase [Chloroflexota bacterium]